MTINLSRRESDAGYAGVLAWLNARWRVIVCRDGIQWILQRHKRPGSVSGAQWTGEKYHRTRERLIRSCHALAREISASALAILQALPAHITEVRS